MAFDGAAQRTIVLSHASRLLSTRDYPKTICPSEIARALSSRELEILGLSDWRQAMDGIRDLLWEMRERDEVELMQKGDVVQAASLEDIKGPIRVRNVRKRD